MQSVGQLEVRVPNGGVKSRTMCAVYRKPIRQRSQRYRFDTTAPFEITEAGGGGVDDVKKLRQ